MPRSTTLRDVVIRNLFWFAGSLGLAFFVWVIAVVQADPMVQRRLNERVPLRILTNETLVIVNASDLPPTVAVTIQGPQSIVNIVSPDDIALTIDLSQSTSGTYTVPIQWGIAPEKRTSVINLTPRTLTIQLETRLTALKEVAVDISSPPPAIFSASAPQILPLQIEITGSESRVQQVDRVVARVALENQRLTFDDAVALVPVDIEGRTITGLTLQPAFAQITIAIEQRSDVAEIRVQPTIIGELPTGYVLTPDFNYAPQIIVVRGTEDVLASLPGTLFTEPIDLSERTATFVGTVPVILPDPRLLVVTGRTITVQIGIEAQQITRQFDQIPLTILGAQPNLRVQTEPREVTILVTGPQPLLDTMRADELRVLVDVSGLAPGETYQIIPVLSLDQQDERLSVSVLPAQIDVTISNGVEVTAEVTNSP